MEQELETFESAYVIFSIIRQDVLLATYRQEVKQVDLAMAMKIVADRLLFQAGRRLYLIVEEPGAIDFHADALYYFAGEKGVQGIIAGALKVANFISLATVTYIQGEIPPAIPSRVVESYEEAFEWFDTLSKERKMYEGRSASDHPGLE